MALRLIFRPITILLQKKSFPKYPLFPFCPSPPPLSSIGSSRIFPSSSTSAPTPSSTASGHRRRRPRRPLRLQWAHAAADNGFSRLVLTAKHHDSFCLWASACTNYSVGSAPWRGGRGDVMAELAAAAGEGGVGVGVYLSLWDLHELSYGKTVEYNEFYIGQMTELLTHYGEIQEVWLDGATGKGEEDMDYLFNCWFKLIHQLQPGAVTSSDAGPDTLWVGDEAGVAGTTCWSLFNQSSVTTGHTDDYYNRGGYTHGCVWVPAECDVSIRPGWFWRKSEHPKSALALLDIYYKSVGRNCLLSLNVPPNSWGLNI